MYNFSSWINMIDNHEERVVANYKDELNKVEFDTCRVTDFPNVPFETAIAHPNYNNGKWVIVEAYKTKEEAQAGHDKWVQMYVTNNLPKQLKDCREDELIKALFSDE